MNIQDIYTQYRLMPSLQLHQRRVAGVAQVICQHIDIDVDMSHILLACLLHDMGNIIKFDLDLFPEFLQPEGLDYWKKVQQDYIEKYGTDEHVATMSIVKGIIPQLRDNPYARKRVLDLVDAISFSNAKKNYESPDFARKIVAYADIRVTPQGVASMKERLVDGRARFKLNKSHQSDDTRFFEKIVGYLEKIEAQIFEHCDIKPSDIMEERVQRVIRNF